jgi:hypothetical protein
VAQVSQTLDALRHLFASRNQAGAWSRKSVRTAADVFSTAPPRDAAPRAAASPIDFTNSDSPKNRDASETISLLDETRPSP